MVTTGLHPKSNMYHLKKVLAKVSESLSDMQGMKIDHCFFKASLSGMTLL
jgi:hypothetical protein